MTIKNLVLNNEFLYRLYFNNILKKKNNKLKLPEVGDIFYFDGYPRSGNTYTIGLIERIFPNVKNKSSHHLHSIAGIKIAHKNSLKTIIIIREPKDAIVSYLYGKKDVLHNKLKTIDELVLLYIKYYSFVLKNNRNIHIINFNNMTSQQDRYMEKVGDFLKIKPELNIKEIINDYSTRMKNFQKKQKTNYSSMPNEERKKFKSENINLILNSIHYNEALELYRELT